MTSQEQRSYQPAPQLTVRVPEALQMRGIGRTKLYALPGEGEIEAIKIGKATLVVVESLYAFVERRRSLRGEGGVRVRRY